MFKHMLDHVQTEQESEVWEEQVPEMFGDSQASGGEDTNIALEQGKPRCI
jgi:hypothetical protein